MKWAIPFLLAIGLPFQASNSHALTGDAKLACEALICLTSGSAPSQCAASLSRYFSINHKKPWKVFQLRFDFLNLCPTAGVSGQDSNLSYALASGAGRCDAESLNRTRRIGSISSKRSYISPVMPDYCKPFFAHGYIQATPPRYVWGRWVD